MTQPLCAGGIRRHALLRATLLLTALSLGSPLHADSIYASLVNSGQIIKYDSQGNGTLFGSGLSVPNGVAVDAGGNVYGASTAAAPIRKYTSAGGTGTAFSTAPSGFLAGGYGMDFDTAGNLYLAAGSQIHKIASDGTRTMLADLGGNGAIFLDLAVSASGNILAVDSRNQRVVQITPGGTISDFVTSIGGTSGPAGIAVDSAGLVYVGLPGSHSVERFSPVGADLGTFVTGVTSPYGLDFDSSNNLFVADYFGGANGGGAIFKVDPQGNRTLFAQNTDNIYNLAIQRDAVTAVPESSTWAAAGFAAAMIAGNAWRRRPTPTASTAV
jgi:sugar lactone lactonase YvrE